MTTDLSDPLFGQYPLLIYKQKMIPRKYIFSFFRKATQIDSKSHTLTPELLSQINNLIELIQSRLDIILVSLPLPLLMLVETQLESKTRMASIATDLDFSTDWHRKPTS